MDKFNIESLYDMKITNNKKSDINVDTLYNKINETHIKNKLIANRTRLKKELHQKLEDSYNKCLGHIYTVLNDENKSTFYTIPFEIAQNKTDFSSIKCLKYISEKLIENDFYAEIISPTMLYISWRNM